MTAPRPLRAPLAALTWRWGRVVAAVEHVMETKVDARRTAWANETHMGRGPDD